MDTEHENEPDRVMAAVAVALSCLTDLLRHAVDRKSMDDYEAACIASNGIRALAGVLEEMNL